MKNGGTSKCVSVGISTDEMLIDLILTLISAYYMGVYLSIRELDFGYMMISSFSSRELFFVS